MIIPGEGKAAQEVKIVGQDYTRRREDCVRGKKESSRFYPDKKDAERGKKEPPGLYPEKGRPRRR